MRRLPRTIDKPTELVGFRMDEIGVFVSVLLADRSFLRGTDAFRNGPSFFTRYPAWQTGRLSVPSRVSDGHTARKITSAETEET